MVMVLTREVGFFRQISRKRRITSRSEISRAVGPALCEALPDNLEGVFAASSATPMPAMKIPLNAVNAKRRTKPLRTIGLDPLPDLIGLYLDRKEHAFNLLSRSFSAKELRNGSGSGNWSARPSRCARISSCTNCIVIWSSIR